MTAEPTSGRIWEPWEPKIGDRVRLRPSAECREPWATGCHGHEIGQLHGHFPADNGIEAIVVGVGIPASRSHRFTVSTEPYDIGDGVVCWRVLYYSAGELELIEQSAVSAAPELAMRAEGSEEG